MLLLAAPQVLPDVVSLGSKVSPGGGWVTGNHGYIFGAETWRSRIAELGIRILASEHVVLRRGEGDLVLAGVEKASATPS